MLFVFNKNKIISYFVATSVVAILFLFSVSIIPNDDVKMIQVSSNISENNIENNINQIEHTYNKQKSKWNHRDYEQKHSDKNNINEIKTEKIIQELLEK